MPASTPKNPPPPAVHLARAAYWIGKSEALTQHPSTAGKGEACAAIATAHAAIAQAALLAAISTRLAASSRNPAQINKESA